MLELLLARDVLYCKEYGVVETLHHETTSCRASSTPIGEKEILNNMSVMERVNITRIISTTTECTIISLTLLLYFYIFCSLPSSSLNHSAPAAECRATLVQRRGAGSSVEYPIRLIWTSLPDIENGHKHQCRGK